MLGTKLLLISIFSIIFLYNFVLHASECSANDRACVLKLIETESAKIEKTSWRDQTYRELAKTKAFEGDFEGALNVVDKIQTPDTQALTIRGIGMAAADLELPQDQYNAVFKALRDKAESIEHPPSYAIALTYIAMSQAFAGDNDGAWKTASEMGNDALRHKAYGETAEIQAEFGDFNAAMRSIGFIDSLAFRNKAYAIVSKILAQKSQYDDAVQAAVKIENAYKKATALQYVLDQQKPRDVERKQIKK